MTTDLIGLPDPELGQRKAAFRQLRDLCASTLDVEQRSRLDTAFRAALLGGPPGLREATSSRLGWSVVPFDLEHPPASAYHAVVWHLDGHETTATRLSRLRAVLSTLRPASLLAVVATVVVSEPGDSVPSLSTLIGELGLASGDTLFAEDIRSLRWPGEQFRRGVCLTLRYLGTVA